jgi:radical SAM protein with 4Fe4S-binding SPASM domain
MHCGSVAGHKRTLELTPARCLEVANELIDLNCKEVTFIGGEIFLFKDWELIANHLTNNKVIVNLMSNGYKIRQKQIHQIKYANLSNVGISLDGTETIHNMVRRNENSFSEILTAFGLLNQAGIPIGVVTSLIELNYPVLDDLYKILVDNRVNIWQIQLVNPMGNMKNRKESILSKRHISSLIDFIKEKNMDRNMSVVASDNVGYYYNNTEPYIRGHRFPVCCWGGCQAGLNSLFIDSVGNVKGCGALYDEVFIEGSLKSNSLKSIWNNKNNFSYNRNFNTKLLKGLCKDCDVKSICRGGCRASNFFVMENMYESFYCAHK